MPGIAGSADFLSLSLLPFHVEDQVEKQFICMFVKDTIRKALMLQQIPTAATADETLLQVIKSVASSNGINAPETKPYVHMRHDLSVVNGMLFFKIALLFPCTYEIKSFS